MTSATNDNEEKKNCEMKICDIIVAKKTMEMLDTMELAEIIIKEKYEGNTNMWIEAVFRALMLRNSAYLLEERNRFSVDRSLYSCLNDKIINVFAEFEMLKKKCNLQHKQSTSDVFESKSYNNLLDTSKTLINVFQKFIHLLTKNGDKMLVDVCDMVQDLRQIGKNIEEFTSKYNVDCSSLTTTKLKATVSNNSGETDMGTVETNSNELFSLIKVNGNGLPKRSDLICGECDGKIVIFNNDVEFSTSLHEQEMVHRKAVQEKKREESKKTRLISSMYPCESCNDDLNMNKESILLNEEDECIIRSSLNAAVGLADSYFINIISEREFFCIVCECQISSMNNVITHIKGKAHMKHISKADNNTITSEKETIDNAAVNTLTQTTKMDHKTDDEIFQLSSSSIPVKKLF